MAFFYRYDTEAAALAARAAIDACCNDDGLWTDGVTQHLVPVIALADGGWGVEAHPLAEAYREAGRVTLPDPVDADPAAVA